MVKTVLSVEGMACAMCESHVNDAIRNHFSVKKVKSSHKKGRAEILSEAPLEEAALRSAIEETGYRVTSVETETVRKTGLFG